MFYDSFTTFADKEQQVFLLDEAAGFTPQDRNYCVYYCSLCESFHRDQFQAATHLKKNFEHATYLRRYYDRQRLKELLLPPTIGHLKSLSKLYRQLIASQSFHCSQSVQFIFSAIQRSFSREFRDDIQLFKTGSMLTGLHCTKRPHCADLNIFLESNVHQPSQFQLGALYERALKVLNEDQSLADELAYQGAYSSRTSARKVFGWFCPSLIFFLDFQNTIYRISLTMGPTAKKAHLSTKLVLAYSCLWPPLRSLSVFIRLWAERLQLVRATTNAPVAGPLSNYALDLMVIHYLQQTRYLPVLNELLITEEFRAEFEGLSLEELCILDDTEMRQICCRISRLYYGLRTPVLLIGELVFGFFKYYAIEFDQMEVCQITQSTAVRKYPGGVRGLVVKDPFLGTEVTKLFSQHFASFTSSMLLSVYHFCIPRITRGPIWSVRFYNKKLNQEEPIVLIYELHFNCFPGEIPERVLHSYKYFDFNYNFDWILKRLGGPPPIVCKFCRKSHLEGRCHFFQSCGLTSPADLSTEFLQILSGSIEKVYKSTRLTSEQSAKITAFISELQQLLRSHVRHNSRGIQDIQLIKFGSLINGFGKYDCDLDLCLQSNILNGNSVNVTSLILDVARLMCSHGYQAETVLHAKVPIVKFVHKSLGYEGDISVYNSLAIHNSRMLRVYADFDSRVAPLGFAIKYWAKEQNLNCASKGSISSYAYIIMMIHYLQHCDPPVLPILQEVRVDGDGNSVEVECVEGWDVAFPSNADHLKINFTNAKQLGELFAGFFTYYTDTFDFLFDVVQIRQSAPLRKLDKSDIRWDSYTMCVQDPFEQSHNLTGGVKAEGFIRMKQRMLHTLNAIRARDFQYQNTVVTTLPTDGDNICLEETGDGNYCPVTAWVPVPFGMTFSPVTGTFCTAFSLTTAEKTKISDDSSQNFSLQQLWEGWLPPDFAKLEDDLGLEDLSEDVS